MLLQLIAALQSLFPGVWTTDELEKMGQPELQDALLQRHRRGYLEKGFCDQNQCARNLLP